MVTQTQIQNTILDSLMEKVYNEFKYLQVDTGTVLPSTSAVELVNGGTQIGTTAALFNKLRDPAAAFTNLNDNQAVMQFILASGEPFSQPLNIGTVGVMSQVTEGAGLGFPVLLPVPFTKTNLLQAKFRAEFKIIRISEV